MKTDKGIERKIIIGLITDTNYIKEIRPIWNYKLICSSMAKRLASWCINHYDKYGKAPHKDIEGIYFEQLNNGLPKDIGEEIEEDILPNLNNQYINEGIENRYLLDQTIQYFNEVHLKNLADSISQAVESGDIDQVQELIHSFKPISLKSQEDSLVNVWDLMQREDKPIKWLIKDLLPSGLTILGGRAKAGKSYFMFCMMLRMLQSESIFSKESKINFRAQPGEILYLALEDPERRLKQRTKQIMGFIKSDPREDKLKKLEIKTRWKPLNKGGLNDIEEWIKSKKSPKLVCIDVISLVWSKKSTTGGGGLYAEEYAIYGPIAELAHKYNVSIIVLTHTTKDKKTDVFDEILGGHGTQGAADNLLVLHKCEGNERKLSIRGKDTGDRHLEFEVTGDGANWTCLGDTYEAIQTTQRKIIIDLFRKEDRDLKRGEIIALLKGNDKISQNSIDVLLGKLLRSDKDGNDPILSKTDYGVYRLKAMVQQTISKSINPNKDFDDTIK